MALQMQTNTLGQAGQMLQVLQTAQQSHADQAKSAIETLQQVASGATTVGITPPLTERPAAADNFDRCVAVTLTQEGGFCNNPDDPGGATNFGITLAALQSARGCPATAEDVRAMKRSEAVEIYRASYWLPARCGDMPAGVDLMVFDFGVNAGARTAVRALQRLLGVRDDGSVGPVTLAALGHADRKTLINAIAQARIAYYQSLPTWPSFANGWSSRVRQVEQAALLMA
jgi:lysozyme family protein